MSLQELERLSNSALAVREPVREEMSLRDMIDYGKIFAQSGLFGDVRDAAQAVVKVIAGQEVGLPPFASMKGIHIIKGQPTFSAGAMAMLIKMSGRYNYRVLEQTEQVCSIQFCERGQECGPPSRFTIEQARKQGTQNIEKFPANMLFARAMANGCRMYCPDVFGGPVYTADELGASVNHETGEIYDATPRPVAIAPETVTTEAAETSGKLTLADVKERFAARCKQFGYEGKPRPMLDTLLGKIDGSVFARHYSEACALPDALWVAATRALSATTGPVAASRPAADPFAEADEEDTMEAALDVPANPTSATVPGAFAR